VHLVRANPLRRLARMPEVIDAVRSRWRSLSWPAIAPSTTEGATALQ